MVDLGYETHNLILNLGSLAIFMTLYALKVMLYLSLLLAKKLTPKANKPARYIRKGLFFNELINLLLEGYIEMLVSAYLQFKAPLMTTNGEVFSVFFTYITSTLIFVVLPISAVYVLCQPISKIVKKNFRNRWGDLYDGVKTESKW